MQFSEDLPTIKGSERVELMKSRIYLSVSTVSDVVPKISDSAANPKQPDMLNEQPHAAKAQTADDVKSIEVKEGVIGGVTCLVVDSRELWEKMGVVCDFSTWIKTKLMYCEFIEHVDFEVFSRLTVDSVPSPVKFGDSSQGKMLIYRISLSAARDIAHTERRPQAKPVSRHLRDCERRLANAVLDSAVRAARAADERMEKTSPEKIKAESLKDSIRLAHIEVFCKITQAQKDRAWQLAMHQYSEIFLLSRDEKACQALAQAIQVRLFKQLERDTDKIEEDVFTEPGYSKAISMIEQWVPSEN